MKGRDEIVSFDSFQRWHAGKSVSPFRYPGGKGFLTEFLKSKLSSLRCSISRFAEPFCGGAGAALNLLKEGAIESVYLNDLDVRVFSAWKAILEENDRFVERIREVTVDIDTWHWAKKCISAGAPDYDFELGFATFFVNRTSRAGIVLGSGPIGGYDQSSKWKIDARFYRDTMISRVRWIGKNSHKISISNLTALDFIHRFPIDHGTSETFFLIDPPYVGMGGRLYFNGMKKADHIELANFLKENRLLNWIVTYDDHPDVRGFYKGCKVRKLQVNYSLRRARKATELLVEPLRLN